jgi:hypothetical protein
MENEQLAQFKENVDTLFRSFGINIERFFKMDKIMSLPEEEQAKILVTSCTNIFRYAINRAILPEFRDITIDTIMNGVKESFHPDFKDPIDKPKIILDPDKRPSKEEYRVMFESLEKASDPVWPSLNSKN